MGCNCDNALDSYEIYLKNVYAFNRVHKEFQEHTVLT